MSDPNYIDPAPADPVPGQPGHLDHHIWLKESALALDSEVKTLNDAIEGSGAWTSYTPAWTGAGSNPSLGDGTIQAAYKRIGSTVHFRIWVTCGSTTTYGSGAWSFAPTSAKRPRPTLSRRLIDSGTTYYPSYGIVRRSQHLGTHGEHGLRFIRLWRAANATTHSPWVPLTR